MPVGFLTKKMQAKLSDVNFSKGDIENKKPNIDQTLKESILSTDPDFEVMLLDRNRFTLEIPSHLYSQILHADFYHGLKRIKQLERETSILKKSENNSAWLLVSAYYTSFFTSLEICKILGLFNITLNINQQEHISNIAIGGNRGNFVDSSPVTLLGQSKASTDSNRVIITFTNGGKNKPHQLAWNNLSSATRQLSNSSVKDTAELRVNKLFSGLLGSTPSSRWPQPSFIRNKWNYSSPKYYSDFGKSNIKKHQNILANYKDSKIWAKKNSNSPDEANQAASIAFLYTMLTCSIDNIKDTILF